MIFSSYGFLLLFLPITVFGYLFLNHINKETAAKIFMILASILFYSWWKVDHIWVMFAAIGFNYGVSGLIEKARLAGRRTGPLLALGVTGDLAALGYFKYANFFLENVNVLTHADLSAINIVLPLAMSFYTFTMIAHLVDTAQGKAKDRDFINYALFVLYFPHLIAGPIVHHKALMSQFANKALKAINWDNIALGLFMFALGLFKKAVIADELSAHVAVGYKDPQALQFYSSWFLSLSYTFQLYFDFSGYCDMAIGASKMMNIDLPVNFLSPYKAKSIQDFWRRWHITLSTFLRDYLYFPLGGNRKGLARNLMNVVIVFFLGGLWHGAAWTYVLWGFLHGLALAVNHAWSALVKYKMPTWAGWGLTFLFVNVAWVVFRAPDLATAKGVLAIMFGAHGFSLPPSITSLGLATGFMDAGRFLLTLGGAFAISLLAPNVTELAARFRPDWRTWALTVVCLALSLFMIDHTAPFLYWNF